MCRISEGTPAAPPANAACLIRINKQLLAISAQDEHWSLPTAGQNNHKSAQCTAHSAVWQTTGLNVEVAQKLGETTDNIQIYNCILTSGFNGQTQSFPVPDWANQKVSAINLINPFAINQRQWSQSSDLILIRTLFNQAD